MAYPRALALEASLCAVRVSLLLTISLLASAGPARADAHDLVQRFEVLGARRTQPETLLALLPRRPPARYSDAELRELARRIGNLAIFDSVRVERSETSVRIYVREKWTLIPEFDLATGTTPADTYALLGVTEYNLLGSASSLSLSVYRERRGFGFYTKFQEHVYHRDRWALGAEASYGTADFRFPGGDSWQVGQGAASIQATSPPVGSDYLRYEVGAFYVRETIRQVEGRVRPPEGHSVGLSMALTCDVYEWSDLTPRGFTATLSATSETFLGPTVPQNRDSAELELRAAAPLARDTVLMARLSASVGARGNANHSYVLGSVKGVRGLEDSRYFTWAQAFLNVELRQAIRLAARWALQGVLFSDTGAFERIDALGRRSDAGAAFSGGAGVRLVPTWLSELVLRFDVARLVVPERSFFYQFGVSQYF